MSKESLNSPYANLVFRETVRDEQTVRKNGGTPTDVTFENGVGSFNGSTSNIDYGNTRDFTSNFSIRAKVNITNLNVAQTIFAKGSGSTTQIALEVVSTNKVWFFGYESGVAKGDTSGVDISTGEYDIVCTFDGTTWKIYLNGELERTVSMTASLSSNTSPITIGSRGATDYWKNTIELFEIYKGTLTASEVANLYNNTWNKELTGMGGQATSGNLLVNGDFDTDTDWVFEGWSINNGVASNDGVNIINLHQNIGLEFGKTYLVQFEITNYDSGALYYRLGTSTMKLIPNIKNGKYSFIEKNTSVDTQIRFYPSNGAPFKGSIDNIIVQELTPKTLIDFDSTNGVLEDKQVGSVVSDNLVKNGGFDTNSDWIKGTGWTINNGKANANISGNWINLYQGGVFTAGKNYKVILEVSNYIQGSVRLGDSVVVSKCKESNGVLVENLYNMVGATLYIQGKDSFIGSIDNVQVYEIRGDLEATDVTVKSIGNGYSAEFNGTTSKIDTGTDMIGTKAVTVMGWVKSYSIGENNEGRILDNNKFRYGLAASTTAYFLASDFNSIIKSANNSLVFNKWQFVTVTRKIDGKSSFYIGDKNTAPALSGSADQDSGTPVAGTTNVIIGNNSGATRTFDGKIAKLKVVEGILSLDDITRYWSSTKGELE